MWPIKATKTKEFVENNSKCSLSKTLSLTSTIVWKVINKIKFFSKININSSLKLYGIRVLKIKNHNSLNRRGKRDNLKLLL